MIAAAAAEQASAQDVAAARLGVQAQLATAYFDMRGLDARIVLLNQTVDAYRRANDLTNTRHEGGIASGIDVSRSEAQLSSARAELSAVRIARENDEHAIAVLIGEVPAGFAIAVVDRQTPPPAIPAGLPSTLLERRPDIIAAERRVAAANARIGVARAALFPAITLGASGGFQAASGSLLSAAAGYWAVGPLSVAQALFDGGRRRGAVDVARGQFNEAAATYRLTVISAFREVEDDLGAARMAVPDRLPHLADATATARRTIWRWSPRKPPRSTPNAPCFRCAVASFRPRPTPSARWAALIHDCCPGIQTRALPVAARTVVVRSCDREIGSHADRDGAPGRHGAHGHAGHARHGGGGGSASSPRGVAPRPALRLLRCRRPPADRRPPSSPRDRSPVQPTARGPPPFLKA